jgi:hypothetical protein
MGETREDARKQYHLVAEFLERVAAVTRNSKERRQLQILVPSYRVLAQQHHRQKSQSAAA